VSDTQTHAEQRQYKDVSGNPCSLSWLVRNEPEWAVNQIHHRDRLEIALEAAICRITTLQIQFDQRCEMMRALEVECGTKDVAVAVKHIKGLKARVVELVKAGEALNNAIWSVQDWGGTYVGDCSSEWEKVKGQQ